MDAMVITPAMIERAGRALCACDNEQEQRVYEFDPGSFRTGPPSPLLYEDWSDEYNAAARRALIAALYQE